MWHLCLVGRKLFYVASAQAEAGGGPWTEKGARDGVLPDMPPPVDAHGNPSRGWRLVELHAGDAIVLRARVWHYVVSFADTVGASITLGSY